MNILHRIAKSIAYRTNNQLLLIRLEDWLFQLRLNYYVRVQRKEPILIFQIGKVGSTSILKSFPTTQHRLAVQLHHLSEDSVESGIAFYNKHDLPIQSFIFTSRSIYKWVVKRGYPYKVITLVREPISRNISAFFENFKVYMGTSYPEFIGTNDKLITTFLDKFEHDRILNWYQTDFLTATGVDIYEHQFDKDRGWSRIETHQVDILILKVELDDKFKEQAIAQFLDIPKFNLQSANIAKNKKYASDYQKFKANIVLPEEHIDQMLTSKYMKHFYTDEEINYVRNKWLVK